MNDTTKSTSTYRLALVHAMRLFGVRMMIAAALAILAAVLLTIGGAAQVWGFVVAVVCGLTVVVSFVAVLRPARIITLTTSGYQVHRLRDAGVRSAAWTLVERVDDKPNEHGGTDLVIGLEQGRTTRVPMALLGPRALELQREIRARLDAGHGYRPLEPPA
ncbi:hypothetical protein CLV56_1750 [Mumia flava]|uniref:Uncharacterized protein n=1 Tax=Mumia flava TaxID=1348852 RepID=A0A0B2BB89_9ACTN|nr:hypothetical protein [Mumia flava]PJJ57516.1 hypothetical protein CLV56_1750 [Mumia flava]